MRTHFYLRVGSRHETTDAVLVVLTVKDIATMRAKSLYFLWHILWFRYTYTHLDTAFILSATYRHAWVCWLHEFWRVRGHRRRRGGEYVSPLPLSHACMHYPPIYAHGSLNAGHSLVFAGLRDSTQKCRTVPRNAWWLASMYHEFTHLPQSRLCNYQYPV